MRAPPGDRTASQTPRRASARQSTRATAARSLPAISSPKPEPRAPGRLSTHYYELVHDARRSAPAWARNPPAIGGQHPSDDPVEEAAVRGDRGPEHRQDLDRALHSRDVGNGAGSSPSPPPSRVGWWSSASSSSRRCWPRWVRTSVHSVAGAAPNTNAIQAIGLYL